MSIKIITNKETKVTPEQVLKARDKLFEKSVKRLHTAALDDDFYKLVNQTRTDYAHASNGFTNKRSMRHVARVPYEVYVMAKRVFGDDVFTNKDKFREAFAKDELGKWTLTVPANTL